MASPRPLSDVEAGKPEGISQAAAPSVNHDTVLPTYQNNNGNAMQRKLSDEDDSKEKHGREVLDVADVAPGKDEEQEEGKLKAKIKAYRHIYRPIAHALLIAFGLGFWIPTIIVNRRYWIPVTVIVWFFIALILFRYIPNTVVTRPVEKVWTSAVSEPWFKLGYRVRLAIGWLCLLALCFGSAFGFKPEPGTSYGSRAQSLFGLFVFQLILYGASRHRTAVQWRQIIVGLSLQQILAMFVLKTSAGFDLFNWIATAASDFLAQAYYGAAFFFTSEIVLENSLGFWFFTKTLSAIIFFIAFAEMLYYYGVLQWVIAKVGWVFLKLFNVSGAEAVVVTATPFIGQGESACLVKPYVNTMTASEIHLMMTSGFATIAGSVLAGYIGLGIPPVYLISSSIMSIPASIAISKMRWPETEEPLTRGKIVMAKEESRAYNALHAFSNGAWFGLRVAGLILCNVLTIIALVSMINGILTYIGHSWGITEASAGGRGPLTLELIFSYVFYPLAWLMGVPKQDLLTVAGLLGTKLVQNEFVAYLGLTAAQPTMTERGYRIAIYALCGFGNLGSLGIQIGVLSALGPARQTTIVKVSVSALACGFLATCVTANIAGQLL